MKLRALFLFLAFSILAPSAFSQTATHYGKETGPGGTPVPFPLITVCTSGTSLTTWPCPNKATITGANPFRGDAQGNWSFTAAVGSYVVSVSQPYSPGYSFKVDVGASGTSPSGQPFIGPNPWFDVTNVAYGAKADGTTDDTASVNAAISAWSASSAGVLYFPQPVTGDFGGCYRFAGKVNWPIGFQYWHKVVLAANCVLLEDNGDFLNFDAGAGGSSSLIEFDSVSGGANAAFVVGPYTKVVNLNSTRTKPIVDLRGAVFLTFNGILADQSSTQAGTYAVLGGMDPTSNNGMVNIKFNRGGAQCSHSTCTPVFASPSLSSGGSFTATFTRFAFLPNGSAYSAIFEDIGGIKFEDDFWADKGMLIQAGVGGAGGSLEFVGAASLSENMATDFLTIDLAEGPIDNINFHDWSGLADHVGTVYLTKTINAGTYNFQNLTVSGNGSSGSGLWDLSGGGTCPGVTTFIGGADQFDPTTAGCALVASRAGAGIFSVQANSSVKQYPAFRMPFGTFGQFVPIGNNDYASGGPQHVIGDQWNGLSGYDFSAFAPGGSVGIRTLWDSAHQNGLGSFVGTGYYTWFWSKSGDGREIDLSLDNNNNRAALGPASALSFFYSDHMSFPNGGHNATLTGASLSADRTYTFPDAAGTICLTSLCQSATSFSTLTDGATISWNVASAPNPNAKVTLAGNRTLNVSNLTDGGVYTLKIIQDGTGSRTLALGTGCTWKVQGGGSGAISLTATASSVDILTFKVDGGACYAVINTNFN